MIGIDTEKEAEKLKAFKKKQLLKEVANKIAETGDRYKSKKAVSLFFPSTSYIFTIWCFLASHFFREVIRKVLLNTSLSLTLKWTHPN